MKNFTRLLLFFLPLFLVSALHAQQKLQIHQFGLGDGDCSLIIIIDDVNVGFAPPRMDTATILIDAQRREAGAAVAQTVHDYLHDTLHYNRLDYVVVSHMHFDHYGGMTEALATLSATGISIGGVYDRLAFQAPELQAPNNDDNDDAEVCFDYDEVDPAQVRSVAGKNFIHVVASEDLLKYVGVGDNLLAGKNFMHCSMMCIAAYGLCLKKNGAYPNTIVPFIPQKGKYYVPKSENDMSYAFLLQYGTFHYFTGGDLGGSNQGNYSDGETPVAAFLNAAYGGGFHVCALKVSHHGSAHSTNPAFVSVLKPSFAVFPAALRTYGRSQFPLPTLDAITALNASTKYFTFIPNNPGSFPDSYCLKGNLNFLQDVSLLVYGIPGAGNNLAFYVRQIARNPQDYSYHGAAVTTPVSCTQNH